METPKYVNKMRQFDSAKPAPKMSDPGRTASFSERVRFAMDSDDSTESTGETRNDKRDEERDQASEKGEPQKEGEGSKESAEGSQGGEPEGSEEKTAPEPKKKTPAEMQEDPNQALEGSVDDEGKTDPNGGIVSEVDSDAGVSERMDKTKRDGEDN